MVQRLDDKNRFFAPTYYEVERNGRVLLIDPEAPHWIATDTEGARIIRYLDGRKTLSDIAAAYSRDHGTDWAKGWLHCRTLLQEALRSGFISTSPFVRAPYPGRAEVLELDRLSELWLHVINACNLSCAHCLVDSSPAGNPGEGTDFWHRTIDQGLSLGVERFCITGGEPFLRSDIFDLIANPPEGPTDHSDQRHALQGGEAQSALPVQSRTAETSGQPGRTEPQGERSDPREGIV